MQKKLLFYTPGQTVVLFENNKSESLNGSLVIDQGIGRRIRKAILVYKGLAGIFLLLGFLGIFSFILPIALSFGVSESKKTVTKISAKKITAENNYIEGSTKYGPFLEDLSEFKIVIPKIGVNSNIISNVDASNEALYKDRLKDGVAHADGSYFPGEGGLVYLFSHSTDSIFNISRFNAQFFAVKDLIEGDDVYLRYKGKEYRYIIKNKRVINPYNLDEIRNTEADLVLQTCWPPGTDWQRLIVSADEI